MTSIRANESVSMRAVDAGRTSNAEISRTPMTLIVTSTVSDNITMSTASRRSGRPPVTRATSESNVA